MNLKLKLALRYSFSKSKGQKNTAIWICIGIAVGLIALNVISSVMTGLQKSQIDRLRNIESFDLIIESESLSPEVLENLTFVKNSYWFSEEAVMITNPYNGKSITAKVRAIDSDLINDSRFSKDLKTTSLSVIKGPCLSSTTIYSMNFHLGDTVEITLLKKGKTTNIVPYKTELELTDYYSSGKRDFDASMIFMDIDYFSQIMPETHKKIGVYISGFVEVAEKKISEIDPDSIIVNYKNYNKTLYSALMLEKSVMYLFLGFVFVIVCVNLKNSTNRLVFSKKNESALLMAIGLNKKDILDVFVLQGVFISITGCLIGSVVSFILMPNLNLVLKLTDGLVYFFTGRGTILSSIQLEASLNPAEILLICIFIIGLSSLFSFIGTSKMRKSEISEVIADVSR